MHFYRISFAGAGKVAGALSREFFSKGHKIIQVASAGNKRGPALAELFGSEWLDSLNFTSPADFIIVAVPDNLLGEVLHKIKCPSGTIVVHTAGSYGLEVFPENIRYRGVFYPLQTFSEGRKISFNEIPVFLEASDSNVMSGLKELASAITSRIYESVAEHRRMLHLAAVFACNFTNHMLTLAKQICSKTPYNFNVMLPLINETVNKAIEKGPELSQTGPAIRNDTLTIKKHLELLSFSEEMKRIYLEITNSISEFYKTNE
ncbi:MAG TPA: DUF2520 domain-containing protein [Bacteroidales bacterium]|nr:DUF2520 domain-containing protein [Bacteroidales bacterium]HOK74210.1 DUF2520 domain-containing protein [Bacteroidales bacterium]HOM39979.1 DUF2520 domain-containing protein [Bacteroidales bacterium]HOU31535.1 DUF2520 domain-containing protein [Bacteroidales bacterium]HPP92183.1 DUF2520 domain-containing protein [Bacteroidales bacterium]